MLMSIYRWCDCFIEEEYNTGEEEESLEEEEEYDSEYEDEEEEEEAETDEEDDQSDVEPRTPDVRMDYEVLHDFVKQEEGDLSVNIGDVVTLLSVRWVKLNLFFSLAFNLQGFTIYVMYHIIMDVVGLHFGKALEKHPK